MAGPERRFIPLLLLLCVAALFLFSYHHSSTLSPNPNPSFRIVADQATHRDFRLIVKVLAYDRLDSLRRCLRSLAAADYLSDRVDLHVFVDHFNGSAGEADRRLAESRRIVEFAGGFRWRFGEKIVHYRTVNAGLQAQWLEAWWPSSDDEFAFVVEDDLQVSPLYYKFLRSLILNYYYNEANYRPYIYGASLQRPRFVPGKHGNKIHLDSGTRLFLYQLVGTWGQLLFPKPWKEFRLWYDEHKAKGIKPYLDGMVTTGWYKRMGERIWTPWFIKFIHSRGYYNFYTSFSHERALSVSHRDAGVNYGKTAGPDSNLLDEKSLDFNLLEMQPMSNLKWYDFCFREVHPERLVSRAEELGSVLQSVQKEETIIVVSLYGGVSEMITMNLLCNFERLNIWNYIFIGAKSDFLLDLARRGHPVIIGDKFLRSAITNKMIDFQDSSAELTKVILAKAYVIKKCIELGYSSLVLEGNTLLANGYPYSDFDRASDFFAGKSSELFFVRSSASAQKIWVDNFISNVAAVTKTLSSKAERTSFVHVVSKLLGRKGVTVKNVDETSFAVNVGSNEKVHQSSLGVEKKIVFWSTNIGSDLARKRLEELGVWMVDNDDLSCKAVVCHQS